PNLYSNSSQYLKNLCARWFLGRSGRQVGWRGAKGLFVRGYAVLAFLWRIAVCAGLLIAASLLFHGAGLVLAGIGGLLWVGLPIVRAVQIWARQVRRRPGLVPRLVFSVGLRAGAAHLVWNIVPWP